MLPLLALTLAVLFFILLRLGILDNLPQILRGGGAPSRRRARKKLPPDGDPGEARRLEVFKDFFDQDSDQEE